MPPPPGLLRETDEVVAKGKESRDQVLENPELLKASV
jgi:hypothetical protein